MTDANDSMPSEESKSRRWLRRVAFLVVALVVVLTLARLAGLLNTTVKIEADGSGGSYSMFRSDLYQAAPQTVDEIHIGDPTPEPEAEASTEHTP